jgi:hypothetical protein
MYCILLLSISGLVNVTNSITNNQLKIIETVLECHNTSLSLKGGSSKSIVS